MVEREDATKWERVTERKEDGAGPSPWGLVVVARGPLTTLDDDGIEGPGGGEVSWTKELDGNRGRDIEGGHQRLGLGS